MRGAVVASFPAAFGAHEPSLPKLAYVAHAKLRNVFWIVSFEPPESVGAGRDLAVMFRHACRAVIRLA